MITPTAFHLIIKHINELDKRISAKLVTKKAWDEISLTSALSDLFDEETQVDENIEYNVVKLNADLKKDSGLIGVSLSVDTTQFSSYYERYVSQSDMGLQIIMDNLIEPARSWKKSYLFQAKRLKPKSVNPTTYNEACSFTAMNKEQEDRIKILQGMIGRSLLYLLYCPRPEKLDTSTAQKLTYLRTTVLSANIFDFIKGLEIYSELLKSQETIGAGIFTADTKLKINNLGLVHKSIFQGTLPLSWFIALNFLDQTARNGLPPGIITDEMVTEEEKTLMEGIIAGKEDVIDSIKDKYPGKRIPENFTIYPKHTLTLRYSIGENLDDNNRRLRIE